MTLDEAKESLHAYVRKERMPGHFLTACLTNDLTGAFSRADPDSVANLGDIVRYIYCRLPGRCHGSRQKVLDWMDDPEDWSAWKEGDS